MSLSMATSLLCPLSAPLSSTAEEPRPCGLLGPSLGLRRSPFLPGTKLLSVSVVHPTRSSRGRRCFSSPLSMSLDHIPNKFREENLKDGCESLSLCPPLFFLGSLCPFSILKAPIFSVFSGTALFNCFFFGPLGFIKGTFLEEIICFLIIY